MKLLHNQVNGTQRQKKTKCIKIHFIYTIHIQANTEKNNPKQTESEENCFKTHQSQVP